MPDFNFKYDRTLKDILKGYPKKFVEILTGKKAIESLDVSFPKVEELRADLLLRLEDDSIFHLELQTENDSLMPLRMLKYYTYIYSIYSKEPKQTVLYIGSKPLSMENSIIREHLSFNYSIKDIKSIDCNELLSSDDLNDVVLSVLCSAKDERTLILEVTSRLSSLKPLELEDYKLKLINLLHLRPNLIQTAKELEDKMPITIKLEDDPFYKEGIEKGIEKGKAEGKAEGASAAKREFIINLRRNFKATPEQIAFNVNYTVENVIAVLKEEGLY